MARRASKIAEERKTAEHVLVLDSGDALNGEEGLGLASKGKIIVDAMSAMGYDAMGLGSGDLVIGPDLFAERKQSAEFPMLSANAVFSDTGELLGQPYVVKEMAPGWAAGITALMDEDLIPFMQSIGGPAVRVSDPVASLKARVAELQKKAKIIIVLSHLGTDRDEQLASQVPGIDLIVGGKSMTVQPPTQTGPEGTVLVQAGSQGKYLGEVRLGFDADGRVVNASGQAVPLTEEIPDDPGMVRLLDDYGRLFTATPAPVIQ